ncbi:LOW QUALITY PROTEIN: hypothetical protein M514_23525 [Trichuris suis]|uniref:Reverse transcriptase domain-containing protein n=1 Tax=Trichuris suis TaxID=68888 RepID=A0A085N445_9BILA|nr:LOW QUALITY PROTEIN: hypothetical protein M514_23525 [Trichuris suis]
MALRLLLQPPHFYRLGIEQLASHWEEILNNRLGGAQYFSKLDLKSGYWQIPLEQAGREKTAFITPDGLFQFKMMRFGLSNAPASFSRLMDQVLGDMKWTVCLTYLDDILIFSSKAFSSPKDGGNCTGKKRTRLQPTKCVIATDKTGVFLRWCPEFGYTRRDYAIGVNPRNSVTDPKTEYLGHVIDVEGVRPNPSKLDAISAFPRPQTVRQLRRFIGMSSYYRRFVRNYAAIVRPLVSLLKKKGEWTWDDDQEKAFQGLKERMKHPPVLQHFREDWPIELHCDASKEGLGAVLIQSKNGQEHVIAYFSRMLTMTEEKYHSNELECLAIVWALRMSRPYVLGRKLKIITDNSAVKWLFKRQQSNDKFGRWTLAVMEYLNDCEFVHR